MKNTQYFKAAFLMFSLTSLFIFLGCEKAPLRRFSNRLKKREAKTDITYSEVSEHAFIFGKKSRHSIQRNDSLASAFAPYTRSAYSSIRSIGDKRPLEWLNTINRCSPDSDWRSIESESLTELLKKKSQSLKSQTLADGNITGTWHERGPLDVPGRVTDLQVFPEDNIIFALTDGGILFKGSLDSQDWIALNDQFPLALGTSPVLDVFLTPSGFRILCGGWIKMTNQWSMFYSDDDGATWQESSGYYTNDIMGITRMYSRLENNIPTSYLFTQEHNAFEQTDYYSIFKSLNYGESFQLLYRSSIPVGDAYRHVKSDMWIDTDEENTPIYLALEDSLFQVSFLDGQREFKGLITQNNSLNGCLLSGATTNGNTTLYAWAGIEGQQGTCWRSLSEGSNWEYRGTIPFEEGNYPFGNNSFCINKQNTDEVMLGGVLLSYSQDGGVNWEVPNTDQDGWMLHHSDHPFVGTYTINNISNWILGTDGGIYVENDIPGYALAVNGVLPSQFTFTNISRPGLNCTQIYKMVTDQNNPERMYVGTQDNGYVKTLNGINSEENAEFDYVWGGDVSAMESGDDGASFWCWWLGDGTNFVDGPLFDQSSSNWSPYWVNGSVPYWEAPLHVKQNQPNVSFTAGYINGTGGSHIIKLEAVTGGVANATQSNFDFMAESNGAFITAISSDPINPNRMYVTTSNGLFFSSLDNGENWQSTSAVSPYFYCRHILVSSLRPGEIWLAGSGYSNSGVYKSVDYGITFEEVNSGLPSTIVERLAFNSDETILFAATGIAPFAFIPSLNQWYDISGSDAPLVHYMDVEFVSQLNTVRFATYARGIWDLKIEEFTDLYENSSISNDVYPNPTDDWIHWNTNFQSIEKAILVSMSGTSTQLTIINDKSAASIEGVAPGDYLLNLYDKNGVVVLRQKVRVHR